MKSGKGKTIGFVLGTNMKAGMEPWIVTMMELEMRTKKKPVNEPGIGLWVRIKVGIAQIFDN